MLENMARNLQPMNYSSQGQLENTLRQINNLMNQAQGIQYQINSTEAEFARLYPARICRTASPAISFAQAGHASVGLSSMEALRQTMAVQSQVVGNVQSDSATLSRLIQESQAPSARSRPSRPAIN